MRITNKVMQNNALVNINNNKVAQDMLNTQIATGKKINRPSEDPIVAIRALRLRSDVDQVTQYLKKNVPDAESWLKLTESAVKTTVSVLKDMVEQCEKGSSDQLKTEDRQVIIDSLNELAKEVYDTGNGDYAGRYIFTGYRTDTPLTFGEPVTQQYKITEAFDRSALEMQTFVDVMDDATGFELTDLNEVNYASAANPLITENDIERVEYYRFRVAYGNLDETNPVVLNAGGVTYNPEVMTDAAQAYKYIAANDDKVVFVPSTGELLLGKDVYNTLKDLPEKNNTFTVEYLKSQWKSTDLRPQHYFKVESGDYEPASYTGNATFQEIDFNAWCILNAGLKTITVGKGSGETLNLQLGGTAAAGATVVEDLDDFVKKLNDFLGDEAKAELVPAAGGGYSFKISAAGNGDMGNLDITFSENGGNDVLDILGLPTTGTVGAAVTTAASWTGDIVYNPDYPQNRTIGQAIEYQVGFSQSLQVNTYAEDVYKHGIGRDVEEITDLANKLTDIENMVEKLEKMSEDTVKYTDAQRETIKLDLEAVKKAETFTKDQLQKKFSNYITKMQGYLDTADEALTVVGNRHARLKLIDNRLTDQKETFDNLKSDNEDADETEVAVNLSSAQVSYEAALMATSDMIKTTLLNYL